LQSYLGSDLLGFLKGKIELRDDIDEPLPEEIIEEFYR